MKIRFDELPDGFEVRNGQVVEVKKTGGSTGDQKNYGLVTGPQDEYEHEEIKVKYSMSAVPRDEANIEAEGGETVLTDLNDDGSFGLYDIKGSRHANGGVPLYLPEQSFVFSDYNKMKLTKDEMAQMGVESKKRLTPAKVSKKYGLNEYYASLKDPFADDIQAKSAELMLDKNKMQLSKLSFIQEAKKDFEDGVPVTAFPFLVQTGHDPIEYTQQVEDITRQQAEQKYIESLPMEQQMQIQALQQYMAQVDGQEQEMIDSNTEQGALPPPTNMSAQQGMMPPPPEMDNQQLAQMGFEVEDISYAQVGKETKDKLTWKDIPGDYTDEEKKYLFNQAFPNTDLGEMNIEVQKKWLKDEPWAASYFENSKEGERWRKNHLQEKKLDEIAESRMLPLMHKYEARGYDTNDNTIFGYLLDIAGRDDYNVPRSDEEIFEATGQRPKGNTSTTNQSPQTGGDYIDTILDYELSHGGPKGAPLSIAGAFDNIPGIKNASASDARQMARDYIEEIDAKYQDYPIELRKRMVDFEVNSEDPRAALMEAARAITPGEKKKLYTNGKLDKSKVDQYWQEYGPDVLSDIKNDLPGFVSKFDAAKHRSYKFTNDSDKNYNTTWGPRVDMWNEGFDYNNWKPGTYYKYDKDDNTYIKSKKATTKEAKEFLDDPQGQDQNIPSQQKTNKTTRTTQQNNTGQGDIPIAQEDPINKVFLGNSQLLENYEALERTFKDPNSPAAKALVDKFRKGINNDDYFGKRVSKQDREKLNELDDQQILDYFLMLEKRNLGAYAHELDGGKKISDYDQTGDANLGTDPELEKLFDQMGLSGQTSGLGGIAQQLSYIAYRDLLKDRDAGNLTDAQSKALRGFGVSQVGKKDEAYNIDAENDISRADGYLTNTTTGEIASYTAPEEYPLAEEAQDFPAAEEATVENEDKDINIQPNQLKVPYNPNDPRFWLQDLLKLNAIANRKRGKFYPWQPAVEDIDVDWVLEDPTRAIAATNEQMNLMAQGLGSFGGPQSFNSRMSNVQAKTAANIANITAGVHNRNVNTTNKGLAQQAQFDYYIDKENRARNTKLYDDTMKVEQNALIEQNFDREQYADALANAYTNMANTYNMNTLYDNYNIDPTTGGMVYFTNPTALDPSPYNSKSKMDKYANFLNSFRKTIKREPTKGEIEYFMGIEEEDEMSNYQREARKNSPALMRGYDYIGRKGKEINKLLPFFTGQVGI